MSKRSTLVIWGVLILISIWALDNNWAQSNKSKQDRLGNTEHQFKSHTTKVSGPVEVSIQLIGDRPEQIGDVYMVEGTIQSRKNISPLTIEWKLHPGVELLSGSLREEINYLANQKATFRLTLRALKAGGQRLQLRASGVDGSAQFTQYSSYNSHIKMLIEEEPGSPQKNNSEISPQNLDPQSSPKQIEPKKSKDKIFQ
jgi:hypothetical protein